MGMFLQSNQVKRLYYFSRILFFCIPTVFLFERVVSVRGFAVLKAYTRNPLQTKHFATQFPRNMKTNFEKQIFTNPHQSDDQYDVADDENNSENESKASLTEEFLSQAGRKTMESIAQANVARRTAGIQKEHICSQCFLTKLFCLCEHNQLLYKPIRDAPKSLLPIKIHLFTHFKEWGRASNTGKLLTIGLPDRASVTKFGFPEEEKMLIEELSNNPSVILYPAKHSQSIANYLPQFNEVKNKITELEKESADSRPQLFHICVIDSTWSQSNSMEKMLPDHIPRVNINEFVSQPSKFLNRKQSTTKSKISTIESITMALAALQVAPEILEIFSKSLEFGVDSLLRQNGLNPAYGNCLQPRFDANLENTDLQAENDRNKRGPYLKPMIPKPSKCLHCGSSVDDTSNIVNFKNCGIKTRKKDLANLTKEMEEEHELFVHQLIEDARQKTTEVFRINPNMTSSEREQNLQVMETLLLNSPVYRIWKCSRCSLFFPSAAI